MSNQNMEMQFANPDWQPAPSRQGYSPYEQSLSTSVQIENAPNPGKPADQSGSVNTSSGGKAGAYSDYSQGYQAASPEKRPTTRTWTAGPGQSGVWPTSTSNEADQKHRIRQKQRPVPAQTRSRRGGQLLALFVRVALLVIWFTTTLVTRAFHGGWILPLLGLLFLPLTTLTYTIVFALAGSVSGLGWLWVVGALLLDLVSYGGQASQRRSNPSQDVD